MKPYYKLSQIILLLSFVTGVFISGCGVVDPDPNVRNNNYTAAESFNLSFDTANKNALRVNSINGPVEIYGVDGTTSVRVQGEKRVDSESEADAQAHLQDMEVRISESGNKVTVETIQPNQTFGRNYSVYYKIFIPNHFQIDLNLTNGEVSVDSLNSDLNLNLTNGNVRLDQIAGNVSVGLTNGQIDSKISLPPHGVVDLQTTNGGINLSIPQNTSAELAAQVTNGSVSVSNLVMSTMINSSKKITGKMGSGDGAIKLQTTNGNIHVTGF